MLVRVRFMRLPVALQKLLSSLLWRASLTTLTSYALVYMCLSALGALHPALSRPTSSLLVARMPR